MVQNASLGMHAPICKRYKTRWSLIFFAVAQTTKKTNQKQCLTSIHTYLGQIKAATVGQVHLNEGLELLAHSLEAGDVSQRDVAQHVWHQHVLPGQVQKMTPAGEKKVESDMDEPGAKGQRLKKLWWSNNVNNIDHHTQCTMHSG